MNDRPIHHLNLTIEKVAVRASLNGFPILEAGAVTPMSFSPPVNPFLAGKANVLLIEARPVLVGGKPAPPSEARVNGWVAAFQEGDIVAPEGGGDVVTTFDLRAALLGQRPKFPMRGAFTFDNEGPAFPALFRDSEIIDDVEALIEYALFLRDLARAANAAGIADEMAPKLRDYAASYYTTEEAMRDELTAFLSGTLFPAPMDLDFDAGDIVPSLACLGRIWKLERKGGKPLFTTLPNDEGGVYEVPVFVALVDGALKVVR